MKELQVTENIIEEGGPLRKRLKYIRFQDESMLKNNKMFSEE